MRHPATQQPCIHSAIACCMALGPQKCQMMTSSWRLQFLLACGNQQPCDSPLLLPAVHAGRAGLQDLPYKAEGLLVRGRRACQQPIAGLGRAPYCLPLRRRLTGAARAVELPEGFLRQDAHPARLCGHRACTKAEKLSDSYHARARGTDWSDICH